MNHDYCTANESLTIQMASQVYGIDTTANGLCFYEYVQAAYFTRRSEDDRCAK